jgi:hypothetical protein
MQMALGERRLDLGLRLAKEVERGVKLVLIHSPEFKRRPQRMSRGRLAQLPSRRELGRRLDHPRHDHSQRKLRKPRWRARQKLVETELFGHAEHGGHVTVRKRALDPKRVPRDKGRLAFQHAAKRLYLGVRPTREIGERARLHLAAVAIALAQQNGGRGGSVGNPCHVHEVGMP